MKCPIVLLIVALSLVAGRVFAWQYPVAPYNPGSYAGRSFFYDQNHLGEDEAEPEGTSIRPIGSGVVKWYSSATGYGELVVVIEHDLGQNFTFTNAYGNNVTTRYILSIYGHLRDSQVRGGPSTGLSVGDNVTESTIIGYINDDAHNGDGAEHVHAGIRLSSAVTAQQRDPSAWFRGYESATTFGTDFAAESEVISNLTSAFHCAPAGNTYRISGHPGDTFNGLFVKYKNTGTATWNNSGGLGNTNYVELKPCDSNGIVTNSWFTPVNWIASQRVTTCDEPTVPSSTPTVEHDATFTFSASIPTNATTTSQDLQIWFRPAHGDVPLEDWGGVNILVQVLPPTNPSNLTVTPTGCSQTNNFSFSWGASSAGTSGIKRYHWNINGVGGNITTALSVPAGAYAPGVGTYTFSVRAEDNAGNFSGYTQTSFCYEPPVGTCAGREIPHSPCAGPSNCYPAASGSYVQTLSDAAGAQLQLLGQSARELFKPQLTYSIGFEYRATTASEMKIGLGNLNPSDQHIGSVICQSNLPPSTSDWRIFWSAPFVVTEDQLSTFPNFRVITDRNSGMEIRNVRILHSP